MCHQRACFLHEWLEGTEMLLKSGRVNNLMGSQCTELNPPDVQPPHINTSTHLFQVHRAAEVGWRIGVVVVVFQLRLCWAFSRLCFCLLTGSPPLPQRLRKTSREPVRSSEGNTGRSNEHFKSSASHPLPVLNFDLKLLSHNYKYSNSFIVKLQRNFNFSSLGGGLGWGQTNNKTNSQVTGCFNEYYLPVTHFQQCPRLHTQSTVRLCGPGKDSYSDVGQETCFWK